MRGNMNKGNRQEPDDVYQKPHFICRICEQVEIEEDDKWCSDCDDKVCSRTKKPCLEVDEVKDCEYDKKGECPFI